MQISAIIPCFNRPQYSIEAIKSILDQTHPVNEVIFINDGSTDNTAEVVTKYLQTHSPIPFVVVTTPNLGVSHARNLGIKLAKFEWLAFLDSDDRWVINKIEQQINFIQKNPQYLWLYTDETWLKSNLIFNKKNQHKKHSTHIFENCIRKCFIGPSTTLIHKSIFKDVGLFNDQFPVCEDYELWLRISKKYPLGFIDNELTIKNGGHTDQLSTKYKAMDYWRVKALSLHLQSNTSYEHLSLITKFISEKSAYLIKGFKKYDHKSKLTEIQDILKRVDQLEYENALTTK